MTRIDARLPLRFGALHSRQPDEAVLLDSLAPCSAPLVRIGTEGQGHTADCVCCGGRSAAGLALAALFRERAVSTAPPFRAVLAVVGPETEAAIRAALTEDAVASGRFRLAPGAAA